jgi:hypothetical protein
MVLFLVVFSLRLHGKGWGFGLKHKNKNKTGYIVRDGVLVSNKKEIGYVVRGGVFGFKINKSISDRGRVRFSVCGINYLI